MSGLHCTSRLVDFAGSFPASADEPVQISISSRPGDEERVCADFFEKISHNPASVGYKMMMQKENNNNNNLAYILFRVKSDPFLHLRALKTP